MEERVMSVGVLEPVDFLPTAEPVAERDPVQTFREASAWNKENFAREQIRGLVRQVFFSSIVNPVRQVVFCAAESRTDVANLCRQVAESLALDTPGSVALVSHDRRLSDWAHAEGNAGTGDASALQPDAIRVQRNLWLLPQVGLIENGRHSAVSMSSRLFELRRQFEFSIVHGPPVGESSESAALGQSADGIVLVLAAHVTRRATALKIKQILETAQVRLLGTVLSERRFPIPEAIYRLL
jgi:hypothetical protein